MSNMPVSRDRLLQLSDIDTLQVCVDPTIRPIFILPLTESFLSRYDRVRHRHKHAASSACHKPVYTTCRQVVL